ncbi:PilW family protein [Neptuniibacter sp. SY11_33]|uniref:PilW family protein n=1 Tax=Neptuniibacter sp. SY11_33 TaxID=3398215 RepID=UPI0039F4EAF5
MAVKAQYKSQGGFSLLELMIAMVMGLFLIGGVISVFIGSSQSFRSNESLSRVQENGRFALEMISHELRSVGYKGECYDTVIEIIDTTDSDYEAEALDLMNPLLGWGAAAGEFFEGDLNGYQTNTDLIIIKHAAENAGVQLTSDVDQNDTNVSVNGSMDSGDIVVLSNGLTCDMFQNTGSGSTMARGTSGEIINNKTVATQPFSREFRSGDETTVSLFSSTLFYVGSGLAASTALRSVTYSNGVANDQELVEDVNNLTIQYGVVSGAGPSLNYANTAAQITAANDWGDVVAVRITVDVQGDENIAQQFSTTVALRNRLIE